MTAAGPVTYGLSAGDVCTVIVSRGARHLTFEDAVFQTTYKSGGVLVFTTAVGGKLVVPLSSVVAIMETGP